MKYPDKLPKADDAFGYQTAEQTAANVKDILANFDFAKVHRAMVALDWKWTSSEGVPTIGELYQCAEHYLHAVIKQGTGKTGSCGFMAEVDRWGGLELRFELAEWDALDGKCR